MFMCYVVFLLRSQRPKRLSAVSVEHVNQCQWSSRHCRCASVLLLAVDSGCRTDQCFDLCGFDWVFDRKCEQPLRALHNGMILTNNLKVLFKEKWVKSFRMLYHRRVLTSITKESCISANGKRNRNIFYLTSKYLHVSSNVLARVHEMESVGDNSYIS